MQDLYFILNPQLGLIKIGVALNVKARLRGLEHACGVPLDVLHVVRSAGDLEKDLHAAFYPDRQLGEWFLPSAALLALLDADRRDVLELLDAMRSQIATHNAQRAAKSAERKAARVEASRAEREAAARLKEKAARLKQRRKEADARRRAKEAEVVAQWHASESARIAAERAAWAEGNPQLVSALVRSEVADTRRATLATLQRERNAALLGVPAQ